MKWDFNKVDDFNNHVKHSIIGYEKIHDLVSKIIDYKTVCGSTVVDIGCSTGTLLKNVLENNSSNVNLVGIDVSEKFANIAKQKIGDKHKILNMNAIEYDFSNADIIVSMYTLQFIPIGQRIELLKKIHSEIKEGSTLIIAEKTIPENIHMVEMYRDMYYDFKREYFENEQIVDKNKKLRGVMKPLGFLENIKMLESIGFKDIDVFFKELNFTGFIMTKGWCN